MLCKLQMISQGIWKCGLGISLLFYAQLYILCDIGNEVDSAVSEMTYFLLSKINSVLIIFSI